MKVTAEKIIYACIYAPLALLASIITDALIYVLTNDHWRCKAGGAACYQVSKKLLYTLSKTKSTAEKKDMAQCAVHAEACLKNVCS